MPAGGPRDGPGRRIDAMSERPRHVAGPPKDEIVEVPLLLPGWQVTALETAAQDRGLTTAQMVRSLLRDFIVREQLEGAVPGAGEPHW
jgi:hypothetical protein